MKRIFPKERIIIGLMGISILVFFWITVFQSEVSFDAGSIMLFFLFGIGLGICVNLITAHTAYTSDNLFIEKKLFAFTLRHFDRMLEK